MEKTEKKNAQAAEKPIFCAGLSKFCLPDLKFGAKFAKLRVSRSVFPYFPLFPPNFCNFSYKTMLNIGFEGFADYETRVEIADFTD
jgi:hypothetical protein